jgi:hypothetical protein
MSRLTLVIVPFVLAVTLASSAVASGRNTARSGASPKANSVLRANGTFKKHTLVHASVDKHGRERHAHWREE